MRSLEVAMIGNCNIAALIDEKASIVWGCFPRLDGDPLFCALLKSDEDGTGSFDIGLHDFSHAEQSYRRNTAIVETTLHAHDGSAVRVTDFAPRFKRAGRTFRPMMLVRRVEPVAGRPRITVRARPLCAHGAARPETTYGSNHIRFITPSVTLRLTTDMPIAYLMEERTFNLDRTTTMILGPDESLQTGIHDTGRDFFEHTEEYWFEWCRYLSLPFEWQDAVIRAAITLKLSNYEETGAIVAAITTSIPEAPNTVRNWDYRYCWMRDSYFVVHALNRLGVTRTMEGYLRFLINVATLEDVDDLQPLFGITQERRLDESIVESLDGYRGMGPVRIGNQAYDQVQNDSYGHIVLAATQSFFDSRLRQPGGQDLFEQLEALGEKAVRKWDKPDAGLWEFRSRAAVHTHSAVSCWAACDRLARIARRLSLSERAAYWQEHARTIRDGILARAWNEELGIITASFGGSELDASLLLLAEVGFLAYDDPRYVATFHRIEADLRSGRHLYRYIAEDDFGAPETAFNICSFWYIDALAGMGRREEAREIFEEMLRSRTRLGLLSEDIDTRTGELWGNFPQTYSMVGLINSAMLLSQKWEDAF
ncbi:glycoside hydrolase family 15 protein [Iodidimonas sp. SYSU 1G8]|uniref:glycoside hydrolase family 15 protein n=1 Tax=Iodidimonas sp. SYSU 1G8 TaxID=3133967 RepID=UPI0031FE5D8F